MTDPKRWLDEGGGSTAEERLLLESGRELTMPSALRKRVWVGILAGVGASAGIAAGGAIAQETTVKGMLSAWLSSSAAKGVLALAIVGAAGASVVALRSAGHGASHPAPVGALAANQEELSRAQRPVDSSNGGVVAPAVAPPSAVDRARAIDHVPPADQAPVVAHPPPVNHATAIDHAPAVAAPERRVRASGAPHSVAKLAPSPVSSNDEDAARTVEPEPEPEALATSRLREESAAVIAIRKMLLSGNPAEALRMLGRARADFPGGALAQEREALTVRALADSGQKEAARTRGEAFLRAFPRSPHAAEVRALLGP